MRRNLWTLLLLALLGVECLQGCDDTLRGGSTPSGTMSAASGGSGAPPPPSPTPPPPGAPPPPAPPPPPPPGGGGGTLSGPGSRIPWGTGSWYLQGVNMPWYGFGWDFGGGGVTGNAATISTRFAELQQNHIHVVRWWVFPGNPWQITKAADGTPTGIDPKVYPDFDKALELAATYDLFYDFVLFSGATAPPSSWLTNSNQRSALASVLGTLFAHYATNPRILSWEVYNEPEWQIWNNQIAQAPVVDTAKAIAQAVHAHCPAYVTVGSATLDGLPFWVGIGLDYYQAHWYDPMTGSANALARTYTNVRAQYGIDRPLVIGEYYGGSDVMPQQRCETLYTDGYAGAWAWSLWPEMTNDKMAIDLAAMGAFVAAHGDIGPR